MQKFTLKRVAALLLALVTTASITGCAGGNAASSSAAPSGDQVSSVAPAERTKVNFWYLWGGDEAKIIEEIIAAYNQSQDKYEAVGLSTPDQQKIITAISGGQGPDVTDDFGGSIPKYAMQNIAMPLDDFMAAENFDTSVYVDAAMQQQKFQDKYYGLPLSVNVFALYYNKDLLDQAGIKELPKTLEELMQMSEDTTKVEGGVVTQLGAPFVTDSYWNYCFTYANGGLFADQDGKLTPDNAGFKTTLEYLAKEVAKFGSDPLNNYITSGVSKQYTAEDPFCKGTQVFRIDGPWFYNMAKTAGINFDLMPLPGAAAVGGTGYSMMDTSIMYIPSTAKNKDGAWDFMKYITCGEGSKLFVTKKGDLPPTKALAKDESVINMTPAAKVYLDILNQNHCYALPPMEAGVEYDKAIKMATESVRLGGSVDEALTKIQKDTEALVQ